MICSICFPLKILTLQFCKCNISESITAIGLKLLQRDYYKPTKRSNEERMQIDCEKHQCRENIASLLNTGSNCKAFLPWCRAGTRPFPVWIC